MSSRAKRIEVEGKKVSLAKGINSMPINNCPGAARFKGAPELHVKTCPQCGREIEIFSVETHAQCKCGFIAYNDVQSCLKWCAKARECVGDEIFERFGKKDDDNKK